MVARGRQANRVVFLSQARLSQRNRRFRCCNRHANTATDTGAAIVGRSPSALTHSRPRSPPAGRTRARPEQPQYSKPYGTHTERIRNAYGTRSRWQQRMWRRGGSSARGSAIRGRSGACTRGTSRWAPSHARRRQVAAPPPPEMRDATRCDQMNVMRLDEMG